MELNIFILLIFLTAASIWDLKERCIPVWVFVLTAIIIVFLELGCMTNEKLGGMAVGLILLIISKITRGQIGEGDGITFLITGFSLGFENNFLLLLESLLLSFMWSLMLILFKKINLKTSLPFLPFILAAFIIRVLPVMSF